MHITQRQPFSSVGRFAEANALELFTIDGNDVSAVSDASAEAIRLARADGRPCLLEAVTYRWLGHVDWREDLDVGVNRSIEVLEAWKARCPIKRLYESLLGQNMITEEQYQSIVDKVRSKIEDAWSLALLDEYPDGNTTCDWTIRKRP